MAISEDDIPRELIESYQEGTSGFYVGAGLSQGAGFQSWGALLSDLIDHAVKRHRMDNKKEVECKKLLEQPSKYLLVAEEIREALGGIDFKSFIESVFIDSGKVPTESHIKLVSLNKPKFILTTNYDMLIEDAFVQKGKRPTVYKYYESQSVQRSLFNRTGFVLKAHGDAETAAEKIILTEKDYRNILYREPGYRSVLSTMFSMHSVIFLGSSLDDPELKILLQYINSAFPVGGVQHYALMPVEHITMTERSRWAKDFNIQIIPISENNNYEDLNLFLDILAKYDA